MTTDLPMPTVLPQSPGRGDCMPGGGGDGAGGEGFGLLLLAEEDPQATATVLMPIAVMVRSIEALPTARPIEVRKSRRPILSLSELIGRFPTMHLFDRLNQGQFVNIDECLAHSGIGLNNAQGRF